MPTFAIQDDPQPSWPVLAWVARIPIASDAGTVVVRVRHGAGVEIGADWFGEAIWTGDFGAGRVDEAEQLFGSACRMRDGKLVFVPSHSTLDRLLHLTVGGMAYVSNSLPGIVSASGVRPDPRYPYYFRDINTIMRGPWEAKPQVPMTNGDLHLTAVDQLEWDGNDFRRVRAPIRAPHFGCYDDYRRYLDDILGSLARNMTDGRRHYPLTFLGTLSNGYDSTAATVLGASRGARRTLSFIEPDPSSATNLRRVADSVGVDGIVADRYAFRAQPFPEVPFLASGSYGYEMQFKGVERHLRGTVLLTGYYGDRVWGLDLPLKDPFVRGSQSGLSLTEYRLHAGFLHLPVPFIGSERVAELRAIGESPEMAPWRLGNDYDRPIARRLIEEAGVPRGAFGYKKLVSSVGARSRRAFSPASRSDLRSFLARSPSDGLVSPLVRAAVANRVRDLMDVAGGGLTRLASGQPTALGWLDKFARRLRQYGREDYLFKYSFAWAVERAMAQYVAAQPAERREADRTPVGTRPSVGAAGRTNAD